MEDEVNDLKSNIDQLALEQGNERKAWEEKMESKDKLIEEYKNEITAISLAKENQTKPKERCLKENLASTTTSEMINTLSTTNKALETERDQLKQELEECKRLQENSVSRKYQYAGLRVFHEIMRALFLPKLCVYVKVNVPNLLPKF